MSLDKISVIIPAYQPDEKLIHTLQELVKAGFTDLLVVNDGSGVEFTDVFKSVEGFSECTLLTHSMNRGKGAALKTAMSFFLENRPEKTCVVTADADGQHMPEDIRNVAEAALKEQKIVLGVRDFTLPQVPGRSKFGNGITKGVFRLFFGMKIEDTQTGLRAFPREYLAGLLTVKGDRYEYETNMLLWMNRERISFEQIRITTVYLNDNQSSHFRAVRDSIRVYGLILKYIFSSGAAAVVDALVFYVLKRFLLATFPAAFIARVASSLVNFLINAKLVFGERAMPVTILKYYTLAVVQIAASTGLVYGLERLLGVDTAVGATCIKIVVDTLLFFVSFRIQHKWVFHNKGSEGTESVSEKEKHNI